MDLFHKADFVTDCTSVKVSLINKIKKNKLESKFILSHPIAGSEKSGFLNSNEDLFRDKISIISKHKGLDNSTLQKCKELWFELGSKTHNIDLKLHDKIFSLTSHLPHVVAFSLISIFSKRKTSDYKKFIGGGLKDFTRIAESDPAMWENIFSLNKNNLLKDISDIEKEINKIKTFILQDNGDKLEKHLKKIKKTKESFNR